MRLTVLMVMALAAAVLAGCGGKDGNKQPEGGAKDNKFVEIMDSIDLNNSGNTALNVKTAWDALKGQEVTWKMEVVDVKGGRGKVEIYAKKQEKPLYRGYNIIAISFDEAKAGQLSKGQTITIRGVFQDKRQRSGNPLVLYIGNAQIVE